MKTIAVMGTGYVGLVSGTCFAEKGSRVICCDIDAVKINRLNAGEIPIYEPGLEELVNKNTLEGQLSFTTDIPQAICEAEVIYIAVGTPMSPSGEADLSYVRQIAQTIGEHINDYKVIVNKSTVPVGTGRLVREIVEGQLAGRIAGEAAREVASAAAGGVMTGARAVATVAGEVVAEAAAVIAAERIEFDVVSNPEFLREGCAVSDCLNMERAVIGADSERAADIVAELHANFETEIYVTDIESAELIKYGVNAFLATKISFINDMAKLCDRVGADVTHVAKGMGMDSRIGQRFLQAGVGFGGSCFPKDTQALVHTAAQHGLDFGIVRAAIEVNEKQSYQVVDKLQQVLGDLEGKTVGVLGLAFKPDTDDMRYAPSLKVIPELMRLGAKVQAYDPIAYEQAGKLLDREVRITTDLYAALDGADACVILTEWKQVIGMDLGKVRELLTLPVIIDGRNCLPLDMVREHGFVYHSIGRPVVQ